MYIYIIYSPGLCPWSYVYSDTLKLRMLPSFPTFWVLNSECRQKPCFVGYFWMPACEYSKFQCARPRTTVRRVFLHKGIPKTAKRKITPFEAHMQEQMQFTAYLRGLVNIQDPRHLKTGIIFCFKIVSYFFPNWRWKTRKNRCQKSLLKSNLECWQICLWFSIEFGFGAF